MTHPGIVLVPHTHWDREWYEPFQVFRFKLVEALDDVLAMAEKDPDFRFTLDGQTAAIEDYLEIRPESRARVERAAAAGQLALGPWLILLDEFLCTGESIVRNLQLGTRGARELGGSMPVGYLPDMFGHVAQMPQILRRAGLEHTAFWRGVPGRISGHAFRWTAPDGSTVRAEYLFDSYSNALDILLVPDEIPRALRDYARITEERWNGDPILGLVGTDHMAPHPSLMDWARRFDSAEFPISVATLDQYVSMLDSDGLDEVVGELRSHARGNILPGVLSIRLGLKQAMATAERTVDEAERVGAAFSEEDFTPFLERAWRDIIESSAHDSVVGSGTDETSEQVAARLAESSQISRAVRDGVLREVAADVPSDATLLVNTVTSNRAVTVELEVAAPADDLPVVAERADGSRALVQEIGRTPVVLGDERMDATDLHRVIRRFHRRELFGQDLDTYEITPNRLVFHVAQVPQTPEFDLLKLRALLEDAARQHPGEWHVLTLAEPRRRVLVQTTVPASGATAVRITQREGAADHIEEPLIAEGRTIGNGLVRATVQDDGTIDVIGADGTVLRGVGAIEDAGDCGDSYNFGPVHNGVVVSTPRTVAITTVETGPIRAVIRIVREFDVPVAIGASSDVRAEETIVQTIETLVEVRRHEPFLRLTNSFTNRAKDHRVRMRIPLPVPAERSFSEGQFAVTERGLVGEGGWGEFPIPTYPATSFVSAGDATALLSHATEYELVDEGSALALTMVRAVGSISVNVHPLRDEPAASEIPIPGGQEPGSEIVSRIAVIPARGGWRGADAVRWAQEFRAEDLALRGTAPGAGSLPADRSGIEVIGEGVQVTSVRRAENGIEVRLVALSPDPVTTAITGAFDAAVEVDLMQQPTGEELPADGTLTLELAPWEIRTIRVR